MNEGYTGLKIRHVGGMWVWIQFLTVEACIAFQKNVSLKGFLKEMSPIKKNFGIEERMVSIEIEGIPLYAWGSTTFKRIVALWGNSCSFKDDQDVTVSCGRMCISTKNKNIISEMDIVMIEGVEYHVRVHEIVAWKVDILDKNKNKKK